MAVAPERSGWRDFSLYSKHRNDWRMHDVVYFPKHFDLCMLEYDAAYADGVGRRAALIHYTCKCKRVDDTRAVADRVLNALAERAGLPYFRAEYWLNGLEYAFRVQPLGWSASDWMPQARLMTELEFVDMLYELRSLETPQEVAPALRGAPANGENALAISQRHRLYGELCYATDVDLVLHAGGEPTAVVEYKKRVQGAAKIRISHAYRALARLATHADLPLFLVFYQFAPFQATVIPANKHARRLIENGASMDEPSYSEFLRNLSAA